MGLNRSFESNDLSNWSGDTGAYNVLSGGPSGSYYCQTDRPSTDKAYFIDSSVSSQSPNSIEFYISINSASGTAFCVRFQESGTTGFSIQLGDINSAGEFTFNGFRVSFGAIIYNSINTSNFYHVKIKNIDYGSDTADVYVDGGLELSSASFASSISSIDNIELEHNSTGGSFNGRIDGITAIQPPSTPQNLTVSR